jgi:hypothetical protein
MASYTDIVDAIVADLQAVDYVENVKKYKPVAATDEQVKDLLPFTYDADNELRLNFWCVYRSNVRINREGVPMSEQWWIHTITTEGWISTKDWGESLEEFEGIVDNVLQKVSAHISLGLSDDTYHGAPSAAINTEIVGGVFCHHVTITADVHTRVTVNYT